MKVLKTLVRSDDGNSYFVDTIEHEGALWLVPKWTAAQSREWQIPVRIIRLTGLDHKSNNSLIPVDLVLTNPMPKGVLDGSIPPEKAVGFDVRPGPNTLRKPNDTVH